MRKLAWVSVAFVLLAACDQGAGEDGGAPDAAPDAGQASFDGGTDAAMLPLPMITSATPTSVAQGSPLSLEGVNLADASSVTIGGTSQTIDTNTETTLTIASIAEATPTGPQPIVVTTPAGASVGFDVDVLVPLAVTAATPLSSTSVVVTFNRVLDESSVEAADFSIAGLTVSGVSLDAGAATLTTSDQVADDPYEVVVGSVNDTFGNELTGVDRASFSGFVEPPPTPTLTAAAPTTVALGAPLRLTGTNLAAATSVTIGGVSQVIGSTTATSIDVTAVAEGTALGAQEVVVTTPGGTTSPVDMTVIAALDVVGATAPSATTVVVSFSREVDPASIAPTDFTIPGLSVSAASATGSTVTLTTAAQTPAASYTVTAASLSDAFGNPLTGARSASFTGYEPPLPEVMAATPSSVAEGSPLVLAGVNLAPAISVTIGGTAQVVGANTATSLTIDAVASGTPLGQQPIIVTTPEGASAPFDLMVLAPLAVTGASATAATSVEVTFNRALDAATVAAGDFMIPGLTVSAASVAGSTATLTTSAQTPAASYQVTAATIDDTFGNALTGASSASFTGFGVSAPVLSSRMPAQVVRGFGTLTLSGTSLAGASVTIGGTAQTVGTNTATQIVIPAVDAATPTGTQAIVVTTSGGSSGGLDVDVLPRLRIVSASAASATSVQVTFNRDVDSSSVAPARFAIPGLTLSTASAATSTVTLTTSAQMPAVSYTVSTDTLLLDTLGAPASDTDTATFTGFTPPAPTEIVVVRIGDGAAPLGTTDATAVFLERRSIAAGAVAATLPLRTAADGANLPFTLAGTSGIADGLLSRSPDGRLLALSGFQATPGTANVQAGTTSPRVVAIVDAADFVTPAGVDTSTTIGTTFSTTGPRGVATDGTGIWIGGGFGGVFYTTRGSTANATLLVSPPSGARSLAIFGGDLFSATSTGTPGVYRIGSGLPTSSTTAALVAGTTSPYGFAMFDRSPTEPGLDTLYVSDDGAGQGIKRFVLSGGTWSLSATLGTPMRGMACFEDGADVVCVGTTASTIYRVRDVGGTSTSATAATIITAPANTAFRGVAIAPLP